MATWGAGGGIVQSGQPEVEMRAERERMERKQNRYDDVWWALRVGLGATAVVAVVTERREEERSPYLGQKIIIKQRKALGIMHLRNISRTGASG